MKLLFVLLFIVLSNSVFSQSKINVLDENSQSKSLRIIFKRSDGSVFELNGKSNWTAHKVLPSSNEFAAMVNAKKSFIIEYENIKGDKYSTINGGNWKKEQVTYEPQGPMGFVANYQKNQKIVQVTFKISNYSLVEVDLHSLSGPEIIKLYSKYESIGYHKIDIHLESVPEGEYVLVLKTPQRVETVNLSIL